MAVIHEAASSGDVETLEQLLETDIEVDVRDSIGWTPLHHATNLGRLETARTLIRHGANPNLQTSGRISCIDMATHKKFGSLLSLFEDSARNLPESLTGNASPKRTPAIITENGKEGGGFPLPAMIAFLVAGGLLNKLVFHEPLLEPLAEYLSPALARAVSTGIWAMGAYIIGSMIWTPMQAFFKKL